MNRAGLADLLGRPRIRRLLDALDGDGEETRIVGGAVRNALLGRPVTEIDFATTAPPETTMRRAEAAGFKAVPTGIEHGTVTILAEGEPFEVTTLREDVETDGRHAVVRYGRDFAADALRRDFTINALSLGADGSLHDYSGGERDIAERKVRFIGDARMRIREDYLRILRFFRFHSEYADGLPDEGGLAAAIAERAGLRRLSRERVRAECLKLLATRRAAEAVRLIDESGLYGRLIGGVAEHGRLARVVAFESAEGLADPVRRLAGLSVRTAEDSDRLRWSLRLSNEEHRRLAAYAGLSATLASRWPAIDAGAIVRLAAEYGLEALTDALAALDGEPRPTLDDSARARWRRLRSGEARVPRFPLRGADLIARGVPPGPRLGALLDAARRAWLESNCPTDPDAAGRLIDALAEEAAS